jgi:hypothetical protein
MLLVSLTWLASVESQNRKAFSTGITVQELLFQGESERGIT